MRQASEVDMQLMMNRGQRKYRNAQHSCMRTKTKPVFWQIATVELRTNDCFYICKEIVVMRLPCFDILIELAVTAQPLPFPAAANLDTANMLRVLFRAFQGPFVQS